MNTQLNTLARTVITAAILASTAGSALAQATYNRNLRPEDIRIDSVVSTSGSLSGGSVVTVSPGVLSTSSAADMNLASDVIVTINDVPIVAFRYVIFVFAGESVCSGPGPMCHGGQCWAGAGCRQFEGQCSCYNYFDLVVPGPLHLNAGDVVAAQIYASAGAAPEVITSDDAASVVYHPACPADFNHSGAVTVQDIFDFLAAYFSGNPAADFNASGANTVQDIFDFFAAYFAGCP